MKETTRPTLYRVMKYWGKKPHNIWGSYISKFSSPGDIILDPFVGSGMTYFESIKNNRVPITIDINPITDITIKALTMRNVDLKKLSQSAEKIINKIKKSDYYKKEYNKKCIKCNLEITIYNYKRNGHDTLTYKCDNCNEILVEKIENYVDANYKIDKWIPSTKLSSLTSVKEGFIKKLGSDNISDLWTNRNLKILSEIYYLILLEKNEETKDLLIFAFIQCLHLTSKMCIPRNDKSNRPLSTSWGRPAYMLSKKIFEQNPLLAFEKAVFNGTGILKALNSSIQYLGNEISKNSKHILGDSIEELKKINSKSVNLVITDPPYGDIIQYGDLSEVWVSWLSKYKREYEINHSSEIIVNREKGYDFYEQKLINIFLELNRVLKNDGKLILTFNSNANEDWVSLFNSLKKSNFNIEKFILQKNMRSSEANVRAKTGIAICDYYLICTKGIWDTRSIKNFILERGIDL
jgi:16S rRNA G966 N2-methylase RsmD